MSLCLPLSVFRGANSSLIHPENVFLADWDLDCLREHAGFSGIISARHRRLPDTKLYTASHEVSRERIGYPGVKK